MIPSVSWSQPPPTPALSENELHIWRAWLDVETQEYARLASYLSADELLRAERFVFARDRHHFTVARGRLRELLGMYLKTPPESVQFQTAQYGKLSLPGDAKIRFNLTHSCGLALYGLAMERELGIDVERMRSEFATEDIAERYFSMAERNELKGLRAETRTAAFFLCWTRKEAYVKALGGGLQISLDSFDVSVTPGHPEKLRSMDSERWSMRSFSPAEGFVASIVGEGRFHATSFWSRGDEPVAMSDYE